jgi:hypothetical protein
MVNIWSDMMGIDPKTFWNKRIVLCIVEFAVFMVAPIVIGWSQSNTEVIGLFYFYASNPPSGMVTQGILPLIFTNLAGYAPLMVWLIFLAVLWWLGTALFVPVVLGTLSAFQTRQAMLQEMPVPSSTKALAKIAAGLAFVNAVAIMGIWIAALVSPAQINQALYYYGIKEFYVAPIIVLILAAYHVWITFEGKYFHALDFQLTRFEPKPADEEPTKPQPTFKAGKPPKIRKRGKLF